MAEDLYIRTDNDTSPISILNNVYKNDFSQMDTIPVTGEIQSIVCSLKAKDSSGYDGISTKILKMCNSLISKPLSYICNTSTQNGVFLDCLKYAIVKPLYKSGVALCGFYGQKVWQQRISTKKCCPCMVNTACHVKQSIIGCRSSRKGEQVSKTNIESVGRWGSPRRQRCSASKTSSEQTGGSPSKL